MVRTASGTESEMALDGVTEANLQNANFVWNFWDWKAKLKGRDEWWTETL
jgi:hypothetical protein